MYISLLNVAMNCNDLNKAIFFFDEAAKGAQPAMRTVMTLLRVHCHHKDWRGAVQLLERVERMGTAPDNIVLNTVLGLCISVGELDLAEELVCRWKDVSDVISCNIILKGCAQHGELAKAEALLRRMVSSGPVPNLISYNTVMDTAVRCMQAVDVEKSGGRSISSHHQVDVPQINDPAIIAIKRRPWELLEELLSRGLEPDRYTCSTLVKGMHLAGCSTSDIDKAVDLLRRIGSTTLQMPGAGSNNSYGCNARLLEVLFNTLLDACISVRDLVRLANIFDMMQEFKVSLSAVTYGTLIKAFGQAGRIGRCHEVWGDLWRSGITPTIVTYGCYIDACIRNDELDTAEHIFEAMFDGKHAVRPNAVIFTSLIRGFAQAKQPRKALELYRQMQDEGIEATSVTFNSVLDVIARQVSSPEMLQEVLDDMGKANVTVDVCTCSILLKASCDAGNVQHALSIFREAQSRGIVFDPVGFNTLLLACSKAGQITDAEHIFQQMLQSGISPTPVTTSIMVKMYGKAKLLDKAIAISESLETEYGQKPNVFVYTCLIQACVQNKQVRRSWDVFNKMVQSGVEADAVTYGTMIHGCVYLNKFQYAMTLVRHAYQKPPEEHDAESPFAAMSPLKQNMPLQPEVMQMLLSALKRKEQFLLVAELEGILAVSRPRMESKPQRRGR
jgi:pentatricopeptide repeat protein